MSVEANFKKHKRFLETIDTAKYDVVSNDKAYKVSVYNKLGKPKGYVVLHSDGRECEREEAISPFRLFITFNSYLTGIVNQGQVEMNKPTAVFKDTIDLLKQVKPKIVQSSKDVENAITQITELDQGYKNYKNLHDHALKEYEQVIAVGQLNEEAVNRVSNLMDEFTLTQYKNLHLQLTSKENFIAITQELKNLNCDESERKIIEKAIDVFGFLTSDNYINDIHENLQQFEKNEQGVQVNYFGQTEWENKFIEATNVRSEQQFQNEALTMLRD